MDNILGEFETISYMSYIGIHKGVNKNILVRELAK